MLYRIVPSVFLVLLLASMPLTACSELGQEGGVKVAATGGGRDCSALVIYGNFCNGGTQVASGLFNACFVDSRTLITAGHNLAAGLQTGRPVHILFRGKLYKNEKFERLLRMHKYSKVHRFRNAHGGEFLPEFLDELGDIGFLRLKNPLPGLTAKGLPKVDFATPIGEGEDVDIEYFDAKSLYPTVHLEQPNSIQIVDPDTFKQKKTPLLEFALPTLSLDLRKERAQALQAEASQRQGDRSGYATLDRDIVLGDPKFFATDTRRYNKGVDYERDLGVSGAPVFRHGTNELVGVFSGMGAFATNVQVAGLRRQSPFPRKVTDSHYDLIARVAERLPESAGEAASADETDPPKSRLQTRFEADFPAGGSSKGFK